MAGYTVIDAESLVSGQPEDPSVILANLQAIQQVLNGLVPGFSIVNTQDITIFQIFTLDINFDDDGLESGVVIPGYTPKKGDLISTDSTFLPLTLWDESAAGDIFIGSGSTEGIFRNDDDAAELHSPSTSAGGMYVVTYNYTQMVVTDDADAAYAVVSADGTRGGSAPGATAGQAQVKLIVFPYTVGTE